MKEIPKGLESLNDSGYYLWKYIPSVPLAIIFAILFLAITGLHIKKLFDSRTWYCIWFIIGGLMEVAGFIARCVANYNTGKLIPYVIQNLLLLLPPVLFAATVYMVLGRIIRHVNGEIYSLVPVKWMTFIFVMGDLLSFVVQGGGAGLMVIGDAEKTERGEKMIVGGLLIQVVVFGFFCVTAVVFHLRYNRHSVAAAAYGGRGGMAEGWKKLLFMLYGVSGLIMARSLFRVAEFAMGEDGYLLANEWPLYVFDSVLMLAVMGAFWMWHPNLLVREGGRERVRSQVSLEETELSSGTGLKDRGYLGP
ncbi:RTA1 like protein-domain-containing protein [Podospora fimiseda]|uniref:RTA1 like protein-domain-containing protein n=1 Tax=Podospora fimiseda TaxID=252190 RepID=A0AAN7BFR6_9PEZI|nr:RTA1 like protein-domain-containing protein [Podospora fimiseda]